MFKVVDASSNGVLSQAGVSNRVDGGKRVKSTEQLISRSEAAGRDAKARSQCACREAVRNATIMQDVQVYSRSKEQERYGYL